ncbi:DUF5518 domain-containing protein [Halogranum rubrum]|uniref:DUF5518 domain-containing protein n=1 Tax=Halogranum salarium B-1 TaxID=1210908 RepID=J2ZEE1_9EURY|nr:DUF5518 domain-containing protein [Halogranum salarium]EJN59035.1 hypothetical protein HSB1_24560 [Halogranum salarium B-1]
MSETSQRSTLFNALIGAVVSVVTAFLPFSPVIGGAVAGYLERRNGASVGALSGVIAAIPLALIIFLAASVFVVVPDPAAAGGIFLFIAVAVVLASLYTIALGALGGFVGVYLADEFAN